MNEWMNEWMNIYLLARSVLVPAPVESERWMNEWMNEWMNIYLLARSVLVPAPVESERLTYLGCERVVSLTSWTTGQFLLISKQN